MTRNQKQRARKLNRRLTKLVGRNVQAIKGLVGPDSVYYAEYQDRAAEAAIPTHQQMILWYGDHC